MNRDEFIRQLTTAIPIVREVYVAISQLGLKYDERSEIAIPLLLASLDIAEASLTLLKLNPERALVPALGLRRMQIEHVFRAAFFAKIANRKELSRFSKKGEMPSRRQLNKRKERIRMRQILHEVADDLGFSGAELADLVSPQYNQLSSVVHGGVEVPRMYSQNDELGDLRQEDWSILMPEVRSTVAYMHIALSVAMMMSPLGQSKISAVVTGVNGNIKAYFSVRDEAELLQPDTV